MRGYGKTDRPEAIDKYTLLHLVGDMVGLVEALGERQAVIVGHDWGAPVAWHAALMRPDRFRGVAGLSVPFRPRSTVRPTTAMARTDEEMFYQLYFQEPGVAEAEFERDVRDTMRRILYGISGDRPKGGTNFGMVPRKGGFLSRMADPASLPPWLSESDIDFYAAEFARTGFRGGLNWYRNIDASWELLGAVRGRAGDGAGALRGRRPRPRGPFKGMDQTDPQPRQARAQPAKDDHAAGLRPLDPAGARRRGERGPDRLP